MAMVVAMSLGTSDSNEERHKHAIGETEMAIDTNSNLYLQTGHLGVTRNRKQYSIQGRGRDHRK